MKFLFNFTVLVTISGIIFAQQRVACIGNSVTYGYLIPNREERSYPSVLQKMLGQKFEVANFGHSGATLLTKGHNPYIHLKEWRDAKAFKPDIAIIHLGLNDTDPRNWPNYKDEFIADYGRLIDTLRAIRSNVRIIICKMTPIFSYHPRFLSGTREWYAQVQKQIESVAKAYHTELIDLNAPLYSYPNYYFEDALHPNVKGAQVIAKTLYARISGDYGGLTLSEVLGSHMVLQRNKEIPVWGKANASDVVRVQFDHFRKETKANINGDWKVIFPAMPTGKVHQITVQTAKRKIVLEDVLMGDVWLCSGQSNMDLELQNSSTGTWELNNWNADSVQNIRLMHQSQIAQTSAEPWDSAKLKLTNELKFFKGKWQRPNPDEAKHFSAIAYYFGKQLSNELQVPIGLIQISVGGSPIVSWIDRNTLEHVDFWSQNMFNRKETDFIQPWVRERAKLNLKNAKEPLQRHPYEPAYNFEAAVAKWIHTPIQGVLWYQGESDAHNVELYAQNLQLLVESWRQQWQQDFPFYMVQLSSLNRPSWASFRNMQREMVIQMHRVGLAVSSDLGDPNDVHPTQKKQIGQRLAALALVENYQLGLPHQVSPYQPKISRLGGGEIAIAIDHAQNLQTSDSRAPFGFELFTDKGERILAESVVFEGNIVKLRFDMRHQIHRVVYAWQPFTKANVINELGYPLSTFNITLDSCL